ncbi:hypothetical protein M1146_05265, partial [Patescibacteria group bacterium]|nr:hypothetical protein [Patescibacteria group bacterium]
MAAFILPQHLTSTSYSENYQEEQTALLSYLSSEISPQDLDPNGPGRKFLMNYLQPVKAGYLSTIIIQSGAVSSNIFVLSPDEGIVWSQKLKKWIGCSPRYYFIKIAGIFAKVLDAMIPTLESARAQREIRLGQLYSGAQGNRAERDQLLDEIEQCEIRESVFKHLKDQLQGDRFVTEVATFPPSKREIGTSHCFHFFGAFHHLARPNIHRLCP